MLELLHTELTKRIAEKDKKWQPQATPLIVFNVVRHPTKQFN